MRRFLCFCLCLVLVLCDDESKTQYDTIVVGLGSSGTTAASTLAKAGKRVLALEAQNRVGGRVCTVPFADNVVELGAEWIHGSKPSRSYDLAMANNITVRPQTQNMEIFRSDGSTDNRQLLEELLQYTDDVQDKEPTEVGPLGEYLTKKIKEYIKEKKPEVLSDQDLIDGFLSFMDLLVDNFEASNSWNDVSTHSTYQDLEGNHLISWHRYGYKTFFELLLNTYNNGPGIPNLDIKLNTEVVNIKYSQDPNDSVAVTTKDGAVYKANNVIVTVSVGVLQERYSSLFTPQLPQEKIDCIQRITLGVVDKVILSFDEAWWPKNISFFGFVWKGEERRKMSEEDYWMTKIFGISCPMGSSKALTFWTNGEVAKKVEVMSADVLKTKLMQLLRMFLGAGRTIPEPTGMIRSTWYSNPFTRGSYSYDNLLMPQFPNTREDLGQPLTDASGKPRVLFAGEATDRTHFSTVHGASDTGYREAMRILAEQK